MDSGYNPRDADELEETTLVGGSVERSKASLRVFGQDLDPEEVTKVLRAEPSLSYRRGDLRGKRRLVAAPRGMWMLSSSLPEQTDIEVQIASLLDRVTEDTQVWQALVCKYKVDVYCGLHVESYNRGFALSAQLLQRLASRGLRLEFDVYCESD